MNVSDTEIVQSILQGAGHSLVPSADDADVVLLNTCAIRENAEGKVWARLRGMLLSSHCSMIILSKRNSEHDEY